MKVGSQAPLVCAIIGIFVSGCFGGSAGGPASSGASDSPGSGTDPGASFTGTAPTEPGGTDPGAPPTHAPNATLTADRVNGTIPLQVNFTIGGTDEDGDPLTYTFTPDNQTTPQYAGNGTEFPVVLNFTFLTVGLFRATLVVSDGTKTDVRELEINASAVPKPPPVILRGHITAPDPMATALGDCFLAIFNLLPGFPDNVGKWFAVDSAWHGWEFKAAPAGISTYITDGGGAGVGGGSSGTIPSAATDLFVCGTTATNVDQDYTVTLTAP